MPGQTPRTVSKRFEILNEKGLHARASAKFVETVERHDADAHVSRDGLEVTGTSIMGLLMLAAGQGSHIDVVTEGPDASALMAALARLIANRFEEKR